MAVIACCLIGLACIGGLAGAMQSERNPDVDGANTSQQKQPAAKDSAARPEVEGASTTTSDEVKPAVADTASVPEPKPAAPKQNTTPSNPIVPAPEPTPEPTPEAPAPTPEPVPEPTPDPPQPADPPVDPPPADN